MDIQLYLELQKVLNNMLHPDTLSKESTRIQSAIPTPIRIGQAYFIRTGTFHDIGVVEAIIGDMLVLKEGTVSWVADSGRFTQAINDGVLEDVEPVNVRVFVALNSIVDMFEWKHALPRDQK